MYRSPALLSKAVWPPSVFSRARPRNRIEAVRSNAMLESPFSKILSQRVGICSYLPVTPRRPGSRRSRICARLTAIYPLLLLARQHASVDVVEGHDDPVAVRRGVRAGRARRVGHEVDDAERIGRRRGADRRLIGIGAGLAGEGVAGPDGELNVRADIGQGDRRTSIARLAEELRIRVVDDVGLDDRVGQGRAGAGPIGRPPGLVGGSLDKFATDEDAGNLGGARRGLGNRAVRLAGDGII